MIQIFFWATAGIQLWKLMNLTVHFTGSKPLMAVVTSLDADHLDIYGDQATMIKAYNEFCGKIRKGGNLIVNSRIRKEIIVPEGVNCFTYGLDQDADFRSYRY